ncbi:MAG: leucyl aminopeptidase family protein [Pseudomonadales bacterium]|nr:leucyl aminopeptidase family protein [Pseudomonadales bacterium]MCP5185911.1 leucyl aminopeptidase family protein [Pseudomonadales bacterium]
MYAPLSSGDSATTLHLVDAQALAGWRQTLPPNAQAWLQRSAFTGRAGQFTWLPDAQGSPARVVVGYDSLDSLTTLGDLPFRLPAGRYRLEPDVGLLALIGWGLGAYRFNRYRKPERDAATLLVDDATLDIVRQVVDACRLARDLINTGADDMLPRHLAAMTQAVGASRGATVTVTTGEALLERGLRTIHAVGRAAADAPRLIDLRWGNPSAPRLTLVGKGVCFDSGGLDLKPASGMRLMKKDMGGAAIALGLAQLIMDRQLPVCLRLLIPAVENAVSGNAYRPGDVLRTYGGLSVEIDNTDAEGRLVLCDALSLAMEEKPDLLIDFATLTGAARSAVGAEISAMFAVRDSTAQGLHDAGVRQDDALWRLPLHLPYADMLRSKVADVVNSASSPYGGAITAALFLRKFVGDTDWVHFDTMAYNTRSRPARPEGGEAMGLRAVYDYLCARYANAVP